MIESIFTWLSNALYTSTFLTLTASFLWGILSILLSPCHLTSIPLIIGFIDEQGRISTKRAFLISLLFSVGILITIGIIGLITGLMGRMLGDIGNIGNYIIAIIFFVIGLHLLELIPLPFVGNAHQPKFKKKGPIAAFVIGLLFGIALGPCTFAYMAPMLGVVFSVSSTNIIYGASLILAYAVGHCIIIVMAGTFAGIVQKFLHWNEKTKGAVIVKKVCGVLVILGGIYLLITTI
ncbi:MAG: cytochrome c biogenesis protein CcdA [Candidatus Celaenobacter polaris]|nr:cytochrome c biogenesis protein CcdA [Candidatus Celaenobacter polaris]